jgi:catechol 2,3-dioxygenase-like lactoylglutathione lyase family enzyme
VDDQDAAVRFYCDVMGWHVVVDNQMGPDHRFLVVTPPGHKTGFALGQPHIHGKAAATADSPQDAGIYLVSDDLLADCATLRERGVVFHMEPESMPWGGHGAVFADPFGNKFFITDAS